MTLVSDTDNMEDRANAVTLITLHQAKGLEFRAVFMVGMEENILPHIRSMDDEAQMEEERRLCYVGMTRAKERLYLTRAFQRGFRGGIDPNEASRFLDNIPEKLIVTRSATQVGAIGSGSWQSDPSRATMKRQPSQVDDARKVVRKRTGSAAPTTEHSTAFKVGDKIRHPKFGEGMVVGSKLSGNDTEVTVAFLEGHGVKRMLLSFAQMEKM